MIAQMTEVEINNINNYERQWKIKTNPAKFTIIAIGRHKKANTHIEGSNRV